MNAENPVSPPPPLHLLTPPHTHPPHWLWNTCICFSVFSQRPNDDFTRYYLWQQFRCYCRVGFMNSPLQTNLLSVLLIMITCEWRSCDSERRPLLLSWDWDEDFFLLNSATRRPRIRMQSSERLGLVCSCRVLMKQRLVPRVDQWQSGEEKIITAGKCKHSALRAIISDLLCVHQKFTPSVPVQGCNFPFIHINIPVNISPNPPVDVHRRSSSSLEPGRFRNKHGESCVA